MSMLRGALIGTLLGGGTSALAAEPVDLDITRIALFSSGVGYFECARTVTGNATAELRFRTEQINDIIKSMVVQDRGGRIGTISYASQDPIEKTLRSFGVDLTGKPSLGDLLDQLRGEPVRVSGPREIEGVIVGVEKTPITNPDGTVLQVVERLTLLTPGGLQRLDLAGIQGLELTNEKVAGELRQALATLATAHDADKKSVRITFEGQGQRPVSVAYLLEAPIWKTSYRLVLTDEKDQKPFIQGWATVENATEDDWKDVRLSLVSGRPISFRMDLYTPLYVPRPLEQLELYASLRPPTYEGGLEVRSDEGTPMPAAAEARAAGGRGGAALRGRRKLGRADEGGAPAALPEERAGIELEGAGVESVARALAAGELFAYHIETPVSIPRQHSAMLPIVNQVVEATKVSIFNPATHPKHPLNGLELKNTTGLNLMQGPVTVFDADIYAGDAKLPDLKPNEKRLVAYALDLGTEVVIDQKPVPDQLVSLWIGKGVLYHRHKYVDSKVYNLKNKLDRERQVILEQPVSADWKLVEPKEPYERTDKLLRFKVAVPAEKTVAYNVQLERTGDVSVVLSSLGLDDIRIFLRAPVITPKVKEALERVIALRTELDEVARRRARLEKEHQEATADQARIRENLKTLDRSTDAYQRQLKIFDERDGQIAKLSEQLAAARNEEEQKKTTLEQYLLNLSVE